MSSTGAKAAPVVVAGPNEGIDPVTLAVIAAAADQVWPRPVVVTPDEGPSTPAWRFSGRWWSRPAAARRERPW